MYLQKVAIPKDEKKEELNNSEIKEVVEAEQNDNGGSLETIEFNEDENDKKRV